ncbi:unnamed protein product [Rhizophagus irregularis]|nr:unnamed protein product [Rhizophagus irregularis]
MVIEGGEKWKALENIEDNNNTGIYINEFKGIGKSYFGILMLVELINGTKNNDRHIDTTVYRQIAEKKDVWCIIDSVMPKFNHDLIGKFIMA